MGAGIAALMFNYRGTYCISLYRLLVQAGAADVRTVAFATDHGLGNVRDERAANLIDWIRATPATTGG